MKFTASLLTLALALPAVFASGAHSAHRRHHAELAKRNEQNGLQKRHDNARWSYYDVGLGACGQVNVETDFIVALNAEQFGSGYPGPHCGEVITMTFNGKTTQATITDRCPGCPFGGLDLSRGLFRFFASESTGIIHGTWNFGGGAPAPPPPPPPKVPKWTPPPVTVDLKPTWTPEAKPTWKQPDPTTTWTPPKETPKVEEKVEKVVDSSSSSSSSSSASTSDSASSSSTSVAAKEAVASPAPKPEVKHENVANLNKIVVSMGRCAIAGARKGDGTPAAGTTDNNAAAAAPADASSS